jgi:hypothetical protein
MTTKRKAPSRKVGDATRNRVRGLQSDLLRARRQLQNGLRALAASSVRDGGRAPSAKEKRVIAQLADLAQEELGAALELLDRAISDAKGLPGAMRGPRRG